MKKPCEEKLEHFRQQHIAKAYIAQKKFKEALKTLLSVLETRIRIAGDKPDLFQTDLLRSTRFAIGYCLRNDKKLLKIRDAEKSDLSDLTELALRSKGFWPHPKDYVEACRPYFTLKPEDLKLQRIRIAEMEGVSAAVGFSGFILDKKYLEHLWIEPRFTNCGIGSALWEDLLKFTKKSKISEFDWMADPFSEVFYLKHGAKAVKKIPSRIKNGPEHVHMRHKE